MIPKWNVTDFNINDNPRDRIKVKVKINADVLSLYPKNYPPDKLNKAFYLHDMRQRDVFPNMKIASVPAVTTLSSSLSMYVLLVYNKMFYHCLFR
jgi:hypothetical protein